MAQDILTARLNTTATGGGWRIQYAQIKFSLHWTELPALLQTGFWLSEGGAAQAAIPSPKDETRTFRYRPSQGSVPSSPSSERGMEKEPSRDVNGWKAKVKTHKAMKNPCTFETSTTSTEAFHRLIIIIPLVSDTKTKKLFLWPTRSGHKIVTLSL